MKFTELNLNPLILKAIREMGYQELTPVQEKTFPHILQGRDLLATAETGSGKTSACGIPLVQRINPSSNTIQSLILVPTRELALQYVEEIGKIAKYVKVLPFAVYGGFDMGIQKAKLASQVHILVATPGRLIDMLYSGYISLSEVQTLILDEADEMLKQGFAEDIDFILSCLVHEHEILLFAATMPDEVKKLAESYLNKPVVIELNLEQVAPQSLEHHFLSVPGSGKLNALQDYVQKESISQAIIFCNSRFSAEKLFKQIKSQLKNSEFIHGGLEQSKRTSIIRRFRNHKIIYMVATDLAGRGLDFREVSHIINYDFPMSSEAYTHRTGRAGRMGKLGIAVTLVTSRDLGSLKRMFRVNRIDHPIWLGKKPDPTSSSSYRKRHYRGKRTRRN
jgi:ATP-dependent RNA helicase DeaD